jgi:heme exporter protein A
LIYLYFSVFHRNFAGVPLPLFTGTNLVCFRGGRTVFKNIDFALEQGEALILRGPNGSGKSSLLRIMAGLSQPQKGCLKWEDDPISFNPEAHNSRLHYIGHSDPVKPVMTVSENIQFWANLRSGKINNDTLTSALKRMGISHLEGVHGRFLSEGQKRRVNLARILATHAPLWLLDEPATALDRTAEKNLIEAITEHQYRGGMVVISSHVANVVNNAREIDLEKF